MADTFSFGKVRGEKENSDERDEQARTSWKVNVAQKQYMVLFSFAMFGWAAERKKKKRGRARTAKSSKEMCAGGQTGGGGWRRRVW